MDIIEKAAKPDYIKWLLMGVLALGALAFALMLVGMSWPLPPACTATEQANPAYEDASKYPAAMFTAGALAAGSAAVASLVGLLVGTGRRWWFVLLGALAIPVCLYLALVAALSGFPCHGMY